MNNILEYIKTDDFLIISFGVNVFLILLVLICIYKIYKMNKEYISFMKKLGKGNNLDEMMKTYLSDVKEIKRDNSEIKAYYTKLDSDISSCIQKVGLVRYNAFKNVGSDLSFAIALLDRNDNGVVFNGLYGSDSSNIYAKPIKNGGSSYQLSPEEKYAIEIAEQNKNFKTRHQNNQLYKENWPLKSKIKSFYKIKDKLYYLIITCLYFYSRGKYRIINIIKKYPFKYRG